MKRLIPFVLLEALICPLFFTNVVGSGVFTVVNIADFVCLLIPGGYYLIMFFIFKKKCNDFVPSEGVIDNWAAGFYKYTGGVIIKNNDKEYSTSAYFGNEECKDLVGKSVSYALSTKLYLYTRSRIKSTSYIGN